MATRAQDVWGSPSLEQSSAANARAPAATGLETPQPLLDRVLTFVPRQIFSGVHGFERAGVQDDWGINQTEWDSRAYGEMYDALRQRGHDFGNLSWTDLAMYDRQQQAAREGRQFGPWDSLPNTRRAADFWNALAAERARDPNFLAAYRDVHDYSSFTQHNEQARAARIDEIDRASQHDSPLGSFIGQVIHAPLDPSSYIPIVGPEIGAGTSVGRAILGTALREGAANAALTAVQEPLVRQDAASLGHDRTLGDFAWDEATAFGGGALIGAAVRGAPHAADALMPADLRIANALAAAPIDPQAHADVRLAQQFAAAVPPPVRTPDQQAALNVVGRAGEVAQSTPFTPGPAGDDEHLYRMDGQAHAAALGVPPPAPPPPRPIARADMAAGTADLSGVRNPAFEQVKALIGHAESGGRDVPNPHSSAAGIFQFTDGTWLTLYRRRYGAAGSDAAALARKHDPAIQNVLMDDALAGYAARLRRIGAPVDAGNLYLMHALGEAGGEAFLRADPNARAIDIYRRIDPRHADDALQHNPFLHGSVADTIRWMHERTGGHVPEHFTPTPEIASGGADAGGDEALRAELDAAELERLGAEHGGEAHAAAAEPAPFDSRPVLRPELFDSPEEHARAQLAFEAERDTRDGFAHVVADDRPAMAPAAAANGAPALETRSPAPEGPAPETRAQAAPEAKAAAFDAAAPPPAAGAPLLDWLEEANGTRRWMVGNRLGARQAEVHDLAIPQKHYRELEQGWQQANGWEGFTPPEGWSTPARDLSPEGRQALAQRIVKRAEAGYYGKRSPAVAEHYRGELADHETASEAQAAAKDEATRQGELALAGPDAERFADPVGEGAKAQTDSLEHDLAMLPADAGSYLLEEGGTAISPAALIEELREQRASIEAMRGCLAPPAGAA